MTEDTNLNHPISDLPGSKMLLLKYLPALLGIYAVSGVFYFYFYLDKPWILLIPAYATLCVITAVLQYAYKRIQISQLDHPDQKQDLEKISQFHGGSLLVSNIISIVHVFTLLAIFIYFFPDFGWLWWLGGGLALLSTTISVAVYIYLKRQTRQLNKIMDDLKKV